MPPVSAPKPDIDQILEAIRSEARSRGAHGSIGSYGQPPGAAIAVQFPSHGLPRPDIRHAADFLSLPLDVFLEEAYRHLLGRPPDAAGAAHYQRAMLRGGLTRMELLGRLAISPEGRKRGVRLPGATLGFAAALLYRIPIAGPVAAIAARLLRLPPHLQDRSTIEAIACAGGGWMKRQAP